MTIGEFGRALRAHEVTSLAVTQACLARIHERNDQLRAFTLILENAALEQAREADREISSGRDRGPLTSQGVQGRPCPPSDVLRMSWRPRPA